MAEVIEVDFANRRNKLNEKSSVSFETIVAESTDFLLGDWERMARNNRLNDYFKQSLPNFIGSDSIVNYMSDLTSVSKLELNFDLYPVVFFPLTLSPDQLGWSVRFKIGSFDACTPPLATECYARCFAILLYLKIKHSAVEAGLMK